MFSAVHPTTDIVKILRHVRFVPQADYPLATSDVLVKAALDIGATWSERRCGIAVGNAAIDAWKKPRPVSADYETFICRSASIQVGSANIRFAVMCGPKRGR
jgi:hypothetical protein